MRCKTVPAFISWVPPVVTRKKLREEDMLFQAARVDYIEALMTQRDALEAQVELIETKRELLSAYVDLYKALGGGWDASAIGSQVVRPDWKSAFQQ